MLTKMVIFNNQVGFYQLLFYTLQLTRVQLITSYHATDALITTRGNYVMQTKAFCNQLLTRKAVVIWIAVVLTVSVRWRCRRLYPGFVLASWKSLLFDT